MVVKDKTGFLFQSYSIIVILFCIFGGGNPVLISTGLLCFLLNSEMFWKVSRVLKDRCK